MVEELTIICPTFLTLSSKKGNKNIAINLNIYRNLHFAIENKCKRMFKDEVKSQLLGIEIATPVEVTYKVFKKSKRNLDKMNVVSIASKYLMDAITEFGCWEDDNDNIIKKEVILPTEIDKDNPRIEVFIKSILF